MDSGSFCRSVKLAIPVLVGIGIGFVMIWVFLLREGDSIHRVKPFDPIHRETKAPKQKILWSQWSHNLSLSTFTLSIDHDHNHLNGSDAEHEPHVETNDSGSDSTKAGFQLKTSLNTSSSAMLMTQASQQAPKDEIFKTTTSTTEAPETSTSVGTDKTVTLEPKLTSSTKYFGDTTVYNKTLIHTGSIMTAELGQLKLRYTNGSEIISDATLPHNMDPSRRFSYHILNSTSTEGPLALCGGMVNVESCCNKCTKLQCSICGCSALYCQCSACDL